MATNETKIVITAATAQAQASLKSFEGSFKSMLGVVGGALSVGAFAGLIRSAIDLQDELDDLSSKTGISARDLSGLKFAADQNGASLELVSKAVRELSVNMSSTPDKFAKLGINATTATGALTQIADIVASMPDGMKKTALLAELMGKKVGPEMADFLNQGGEAIGRYVERGKQIYNVTDEGAAAAGKFKDQMAELQARTTGFGIAIANDLLPGLLNVSQAMNDFAKDGGSFLPVGGAIKTIFETFIVLGAEVSFVFKMIGLEIGGMAAQLTALATGDFKGFKDIGEQMRADATAARKTLDEFNERVINGSSTPAPATNDKPKEVPKAVNDLLANGGKNQKTFDPEGDFWFAVEEQRAKNRKKAQEDYQRGSSVVDGLSIDFSNDAAKKQRDLNSPLMSASDKQHADNLAAVAEKAARAKEAIDALNLSDEERLALTAEVTALTAAQVTEMETLRRQVDANNASWQFGAQTAMRAYVDEAANVAKQTEQMFTRAFTGMEDALVSFVKTGKLDFSSLADSIISDIVRMQAQKLLAGAMGWFGGGTEQSRMLAAQWNADGGVYNSPSLSAYSGGVYSSPQVFAFAKGVGVFGEAGPEAIMPLKRGADGKLGVTLNGGGSGNISFVVNVTANGTTTTEGSKSELAGVGEKIGTAVRAVMLEEMRPGGMLAGAR